MNKVYLDKVDMLLHVIPLVTDEECFAMHGGTAINLFVNNLSRLSVEFEGMSDIPFTYADFEQTRANLIDNVNAMLTDNDKKFLISFELSTPDWTLYDHPEFADYPSVRWKLQNLKKLAQTNYSKLQAEADKLRDVLLNIK